jgi:hypothetical protein
MTCRLLNNGRLPPALLARLGVAYTLTNLNEQADPSAHLAAHGADYEALVTSAAVGADAALLARLPRLKVISSFGVGLDKIDLAAARAQGVAVGYTPDVLNDCVADTAWGLLIDVARGFSAADRYVRRGQWPQGPYTLGRKVSGARLGIVGMGRIGRSIAQRSVGFEMAVRYHTRTPVADVPWAHEASLMDLALARRRCRRQRLAGHAQQLQRRDHGPPGLGFADHRPAARRGRLPAMVTMLQAISTTATVPVVRVPWLEPGILMKALDAGAYGVICPMVNTREDAQKLVAYTHYAPRAHAASARCARCCMAAPTIPLQPIRPSSASR